METVDPKTQLEKQIEIEKMTIPVPEKTIEAAMNRAHAIASKLRSVKFASLSADQKSELYRIAEQLRNNIVDTGVVAEDTEKFAIDIPEETQACADAFAAFEEECQEAIDTIEDQKIEAGEKIVRLASQIAASKNPVSVQKVYAKVRQIVAGATVLDVMKNRNNIETKAEKGQPLISLVNWNAVSISKSTMVKDLTVQDLKDLLVSLKGGKGFENEEEAE